MTSDIKRQLHDYIDLIEDESALQLLNEAAEAYITNQPDILNILTGEQLKRLEESQKQLLEGKSISHEEVIKRSRQWLKGRTK